MKIIFLNTWQGTHWQKIADFIRKEAPNTDVFCFQEVAPQQPDRYQELLPEYGSAFTIKKYTERLNFGQLVLVRKPWKILTPKTIFAGDQNLGLALRTDLKGAGKELVVENVHGYPDPGSKLDTPDRLAQSQGIINSLLPVKLPTIVGGDFNLYPDTQSVTLFEKAGYRNLIKEFNIKNTRNRLSWEFHSKNTKFFEKQYFADYVFVSPQVKVKSFEVPYVEISDHLPQILEFEI